MPKDILNSSYDGPIAAKIHRQDQDSSSYDEEEDDLSWIQWFCALKGHEFLIEVPQSYFKQPKNLLHLES